MIAQYPPGPGARGRPRTAAWLGVVVACCATAACGLGDRELRPGDYRGVITTPEGELPFGLHVARDETGLALHLVNGGERVRVSQVEVAEGQLTARFEPDAATVTAKIRGDRLSGRVTLPGAGGGQVEYPFAAHAGQKWRFFEEPVNDNADVSGRWDVTLTADGAPVRRADARLQQSFEQVTATIGTTDSPGGLLAGEVRHDDVYLSRYDGITAELCHARLQDDGGLAGWCWSAARGRESFEARRNAGATPDEIAADPAPASVPQATVPSPAPTP
ncbi:MAG: hypothetical protein EHM60_10065 [Lysobacterales bacterium]|nr:MAG: hypothetical protein EHM60_10065 [Xanthomonadales bacterium]